MSSPNSEQRGRPTTAGPEHNWRPTVVHGAVLWLLVGLAGALPLGATFDLGVAVVAILVGPVLPVAVWCDYRQASEQSTCAPGLVAYAKNLGRDLMTTLASREPLGSDRRLLDC